MAFVPKVNALLADRGATFANYFVTLSTCCPSRASILRGQYPHNHGVNTNLGPSGGFPKFHAEGFESSTIATWLKSAGYRTALMGKYLNDYPGTGSTTYVPPGWDVWFAVMGPPWALGIDVAYYDYVVNENSTNVRYHVTPPEYETDVLRNAALAFICAEASDSEPFFLYLTPYAPHEPATPAPRHVGAFAGVTVPHTPSFNEADVSDKPVAIRSLPLLGPDTIALMDTLYEHQLESLQGVDDMLQAIVDVLTSTHQLDNTYIFYSSDNGYHMGQHRLGAGKATIYEEDIHVPLVVRGPGIPAGAVYQQLVANIDLAPTFAELAGAAVPAFVDGRSLVPILTGDGAVWRKGLLFELQGTGISNGAIRTGRYLYRRVGTAREMYDLIADPYELQNIALTADSTLEAGLDAWLTQLKPCVGAICRAVEDSVF